MRLGVVVALAFLIICVLVLVAFVIIPGSQKDAGRSGATTQVIDAADTAVNGAQAVEEMGLADSAGQTPRESYDGAPADLLAVPGSSSVIGFSVANGSVSTNACAFDIAGITQAIANIEEYGACGFVFFDLGAERGIAYNADEVLYIASAAKAVMTLYALTNDENAADSFRFSIEEAILYSDNDAYEDFAYAYSDGNYLGWLADHEVYHENPGDLYPPMSARSLACFWAELCQFVQGGSPDAEWLAGLLGSTETSFIRDAIADTGADVMNKGGWIGEDWYLSVSDAAVIEYGSHAYIMAIVTGQPDGGITEGNVSELARALFDVRDQM